MQKKDEFSVKFNVLIFIKIYLNSKKLNFNIKKWTFEGVYKNDKTSWLLIKDNFPSYRLIIVRLKDVPHINLVGNDRKLF